MACPQVAVGGEALQIRKVTANGLDKWLTSPYSKNQACHEYYTGLQNRD
jgi:hypothetical protein